MIANEKGRPCLAVGAPMHPQSGASRSSDAPESNLSQSAVAILMRIADVATANRLFAPFMQNLREGDGETFEPEITHGPFSCLDTECGRETCIAFQERILASYPNGFTRCCVCSQTVDNRARLACSSCAS
jgi:hypothetical protein